MKTTILLNLVVLLVTAALAPAGTRLVPSEYATIQDAIDAAVDGDVVIVAERTYFENINFSGRNIHLRSTDPNNPDVVAATVIDGGQNASVVTFSGSEYANCLLNGFTITNGHADDGGGICCRHGNPTISNCKVIGNLAYYGGGIYCGAGSNPTIENCFISGNLCGAYAGPEGEGGGIYCATNSNSLINHCTISSNWAYKFGGGICCKGSSSPTINDCTIKANMARLFHGGGIYCAESSSPYIRRCNITENHAGFLRVPGDPRPFSYHHRGGGIFCTGSSPTIEQCTISNSWTDGDGSGICCYGGEPKLAGCVISGNSASGHGGAVCFYSGKPTIKNSTITHNFAGRGGTIYCNSRSHLQLINSILWSNWDRKIILEYYSHLTVLYSDVQGGQDSAWLGNGCTLNWAESNINANPLFASGYHLSVNSPCVNAGDPSYSPTLGEIDIDGDQRVINGRVDMGADELNYEGPIIGISPTKFEFSSHEGGSNPEEQILSIHNKGMGTINWDVTEYCSWLQVYPTNGESTGDIDEVTLSVDISELNPGLHTCVLTITADGAVNSPRTVEVTLYLYDTGVMLVPSEYKTIQQAIDWAYHGATIIVADGTYTWDRNIDFKGKAITVCSENGPENCIIDCHGEGRGFHFHSGEDANSILDGLTITNGYAKYGGGIYCEDSRPTITNCTITGNTARYGGGGIYCSGSSPTITNCTFSDNWAETIGGGIYNYESSPMLTNCTFSSNSADEAGGGVHNGYYSSPTLNNCTFSGNFAGAGGGMSNRWGSSPTLTNCVFSGNSATYGGGGVYNYGESNPTLNNCTISGNSAGQHGGGIWYQYGGGGPPMRSGPPLGGALIIINCILWGDTPEEIYVSDGTMVVTYCDVESGWPGEGNIDANPCFAEPGYWADENDPNTIVEPNDPNAIWIDGDYHLKSEGWRWDANRKVWTWDEVTSPCIDAGNPGCGLGDELLSVPDDPNNEWGENLRINMGAYGGTAEASMGLPGWALLADLTNDRIVDFDDLAAFVNYWLETGECIPSDLNRSQAVDFVDFALMGSWWLEER